MELGAIAGSTWGFKLEDMRKLYLGAMRPQILFGSSVWYTPFNANQTSMRDKEKIRRLESIQKRAALIIAGAFKLTAAEALDIELHLQPIKAQLTQANGEAHLRLIRSPIYHHIGNQGNQGKDHRARYLSPFRKLLQYYYEELKLLIGMNPTDLLKPQVEEIQPWIVPPWWEGPTIHVAETAEEATRIHDEITSINQQGTHHVYTDGSGLNDKIGAAAVSYHHGTPIGKLQYMGSSKNSTVYAAELTGIDMALAWGLDDTWLQCSHIHIWTDSQAAISSIDSPRCPSGQYILKNIVAKLDDLALRHIKVTIRWIPAHTGIPGNERADEAAKAATEAAIDMRGATRYLTACLKQLLRGNLKQAWEQRWKNSKHGRSTYRLNNVPTIKLLESHKALRKAESSIYIQLRTGKIGLNKFLFDINRSDTKYCQRCNGTSIQTVQHVLLQCPGLAEQRRTWLTTLRNSDLRKLLTDPLTARKVTNFMIDSGLLGQFHTVTVADPTPTRDLGS